MDTKKRKEEILKLIEGGINNVKAIAQHFGVSLMTIYRDVRELEKEGRIVRKHGELKLRGPEEDFQDKLEYCGFCKKSVDKRLEFVYITDKGKRIKACCAHCGLLLYKNFKEGDISSCTTWDFISGNLVSCFSAFYVVGSNAMPCCLPSAIAFGNEEDAKRFAKGFGGVVVDFEGAVKAVEELMKRGQPVRFSL